MLQNIVSSGSLWTMITAIIAIVVLVLNRMDIRKNGVESKGVKWETALSTKRDVEDCITYRLGHDKDEAAFRCRIGKEVDSHDLSLNMGGTKITRLEKGMIFLVQKAGGDPASMGLYD